MRIAILIDTLAAGGAERQAIMSAFELRKIGHDVDLVYYHPTVEYTGLLTQTGIKPLFIPARSATARCGEFHALFRRRAYDVVHGFKIASEMYAAFAGAWARIPGRFGSYRGLYQERLGMRLLHRCVDRLLSGWIVNSGAIADSMARKTGIPRRRFAILHNGVSPEAFSARLDPAEARAQLGLPVGARVITMVARLEPGKNHPMLFAAARSVLQAEPASWFLVVGKGSLESRLRQLVDELGISHRVLFLGHRSDIPEILAATTVAVLTSDSEGLPNAVIEAFAAGRPVVCTDYEGSDELLQHEVNALVSRRGDPDLFARNILRLLQDEPLRERLAAKAREDAASCFEPQTMARNLERIYLEFGASSLRAGKVVKYATR